VRGFKRVGVVVAGRKKFKTLDVPTAATWSSWLAKNHATEHEIWLVFHKIHTGRPSISYADALDEALCFGWVDSLIRRLDEDRYARKFTPRKVDSKWSTINRKRYAELKAAGRLMKPGLDRPPTDRSGDAPKMPAKLPAYIKTALAKNAAAQKFFESLAPSHRHAYVTWIESAKKEETKRKRLNEAIIKLAAGQRLGLNR
jgi:uncharacterized protein YdeI (YjbR/CyaY-like superfamily)